MRMRLTFDWRTILHPDDMARIVKESIAGEAALKPFVLEGRYRRADGAWRWMRSESQPRWDPTGKHIGFIGVAHDVTVAKEAENELRHLNETLEERIEERTSQLQSNEAQMRAIFETSNQYQGLLDLQGNVLYANATALAGYSRQRARRRRQAVLGLAVVCRNGGDARNRHRRHSQRRRARRKRADGNAAQSARRRALFRFHHAPGVRSARRCLRSAARGGRHHRAAAGRGGASPIAEDGCDRPAHRRRRPRFQ